MHVEESFIPMPDGIRLAADLFFPEDLGSLGPVPAILEYLPYRKDDGRERTWDLFSYAVERGYLGARVDIRGTGRSEGHPPDREYSDQEQTDGEVVIDWLAHQPWSNGNVGMWGISWGGFNSIQMAMREPAPPALKAICALMATDDLFHDDIHYIDGMMHIDEYVVMIDLLNAMTPAPDFPVDEEILAARFDNPPWLLTWLKQQRNGPFWHRGSLRPRYDRIKIPSYLIGGYYDGYRDSVPRMLEQMSAPVRAMMGPWNHVFPHDALPGPEIEWRADVLRWWDRWLKGKETGIEDEPSFAVYMRRPYPPGGGVRTIPGEWRFVDGWPPPGLRSQILHLGSDHRLSGKAGPEDVHRLAYVPSAGANASMWWGELTPDQRPADAFGLVYETEPFDDEVEILGFPRLELKASADVPLAHWFGRISDVAPDGTTVLVAGGGINGAHRDSMDDPKPLEPGRVHDISFELHFTSWVFTPGHRLRLAVSNATFPMIWPTPSPMTTSLVVGGAGGSRLILPVSPPADGRAPTFEPPTPVVRPEGYGSEGDVLPDTWTVIRDEAERSTRVEWEGRASSDHPWGRKRTVERLAYRVEDFDPAHASVRGEAIMEVDLPDRLLRWHHLLDVRSDEESFGYSCTRELFENEKLIRTKSWEEKIPRDHQ